MENTTDHSLIPGWGMDADPKNEPTYPIKKYTGDDHERLNWQRPQQQPASVEILKSNERPVLSAVFGTTSPPSGLSGVIRRRAFKYSESEYGHWLNLLLADRVNVVEGFLQDLGRGIIPNIFSEKGWKADWQHNKKAIVKRAVITTVVAGVVFAYFTRRKKRSAMA